MAWDARLLLRAAEAGCGLFQDDVPVDHDIRGGQAGHREEREGDQQGAAAGGSAVENGKTDTDDNS